eukprot:TRINITY_DN14903_c0_g1_i2.p2 TRINITY_DN14903_c0_g1~~TRINITY_DN14903_c0_g1_i2.p2  ORF type:complete len:107 (-),score=10.20 TRINITY_DN14903_c0_g1_i2:179-463(-)
MCIRDMYMGLINQKIILTLSLPIHAKNVKEISTIKTANKMQIVHNYELSEVFNRFDNFFQTKFIFFQVVSTQFSNQLTNTPQLLISSYIFIARP